MKQRVPLERHERERGTHKAVSAPRAFAGRSAGSLHATVLGLQRSAGNRAVSSLLVGREGSGRHEAPVAVQRVSYGTDPVATIQPGDKDLLYGIGFHRSLTKQRLAAQQGKNTIRTIDDYNRAIGINDVLFNSKTAGLALYDVRAELNVNGAWAALGVLQMDAALNTATNQAAIQQWITTLRGRASHIGLEDLGASGGFLSKAKIERKNRFKKNRKESQAQEQKADRLTVRDTRTFLSGGHNKTTAQQQYDGMSQKKQSALNEWVYRAFFRRTSKLGQDFVIGLGGKVHFNTMADPDWDPVARVGPGVRDHGLKTMSEVGETGKNRSITVSEYRHMKKLKKLHPNAFSVYGE